MGAFPLLLNNCISYFNPPILVVESAGGATIRQCLMAVRKTYLCAAGEARAAPCIVMALWRPLSPGKLAGEGGMAVGQNWFLEGVGLNGSGTHLFPRSDSPTQVRADLCQQFLSQV